MENKYLEVRAFYQDNKVVKRMDVTEKSEAAIDKIDDGIKYQFES